MSTVDFEAEYNNRARVPAYASIAERWDKASAEFRSKAPADLDIAYGSGERQRYDLFHAASRKAALTGTATRGDSAPLAVFIHGGYWQRGDRKSYSFVARELTNRGLAVAVPSYTLCPAASVIEIVGEMRLFLKDLWDKTRRHPVIVGNSAGGHLTAAMLATDWTKVAGVPADLVRAGYAMSGVYDLAPLIPTSLNPALKLDAATAHAAGPLFWPAPPKNRTFVAAVGADESREFLRQSLEIVDAWSRAGVKAECVVVPSTNHFTIVDELTRPDSAMLARIESLANL